jgi:hypothetical protein
MPTTVQTIVRPTKDNKPFQSFGVMGGDAAAGRVQIVVDVST